MKQLERTAHVIFSIIGVSVFTLCTGSFAIGVMRGIGATGFLVLLPFLIIFTVSLLLTWHLRRFFMRFAAPVVSFLGDELSTNVFSVKQIAQSLCLLLSIPLLAVFAMFPTLHVVGALGFCLFVMFCAYSKNI